MRANELRIGNLVFAGDKALSIGYIHIQVQVGSPETFKPIPLTPEWLVKFGFEKPKNRDCHIKKRLQIWKQMCYLIEEDTMLAHWIPVKLEHVHQLQNLYFALTGEELEIK